MEDRRTLVALFLCVAVVLIYTQLVFAPPPQPVTVAPTTQDASTASQASSPTLPSTVNNPPLAQTVAPVSASAATSKKPSMEEINSSGLITIENDRYILTLAKLGARITSLKVKGFRAERGGEDLYNMVSTGEGMELPLGVYAGSESDSFTHYTLDSTSPAPTSITDKNSSYVLADSGTLPLSFSGTLPDGTTIKKIFSFAPHTHLFDVTVQLGAPTKDNTPIWLEWSHFITNQDQLTGSNPKKFTLLDDQSKIKNTLGKDVVEGVTELGKGSWISINDYYFLEALITTEPATFARDVRAGNSFSARISGTPTGIVAKVYSGPKDVDDLQIAGSKLEKSVDLGVFSVIAGPILMVMKFFYKFLGNYGLSIILLTLLIKLAFLPLTQASFKSMRAMQELQPEVKALRERIQDPTELNNQMMALYKKRGVNPLGGCLPIFIQIPVFFGLYNALLNSISLRHAPFALWIVDLSAPEQLHLFGIGVPLMIIIMGISMIAQQWLTPSAMDESQKRIMMIMPVVFTGMFILHPMPSGLVLYWLVNNVISIVQQVYLRNDTKAGPLKATAYASLGIFTFGYILTLI